MKEDSHQNSWNVYTLSIPYGGRFSLWWVKSPVREYETSYSPFFGCDVGVTFAHFLFPAGSSQRDWLYAFFLLYWLDVNWLGPSDANPKITFTLLFIVDVVCWTNLQDKVSMWILFILLLLGFMLVCALLCACMYSALLILCLFVHWLILMFRPYDDPFLMVSSREEIKRKLQVLKHDLVRDWVWRAL